MSSIGCVGGEAFSQTLYDEHDQVVKWVKGRLSSEGCFLPAGIS
ncbi:hypothetical protein ACLK2E_08800 [Escherichia coli]